MVEESADRIGAFLAAKDRKYTDFIIKDSWKDSGYDINLTNYITIYFDINCLDEYCKKYEYIPKIRGVHFVID